MRKISTGLIGIAALALAASSALAQPGTGPISGGGGGGGVTGLTSCAGGTALADNAVLRGDGTTACQGSAVTVADTTGAISGAQSITGGTSGTSTLTLDGDSTVAGVVTVSAAGRVTAGNGFAASANSAFSGIEWATSNDSSAKTLYDTGGINLFDAGTIRWSSTTLFTGSKDTGLARSAAGVVKVTDGSTGTGALIASGLTGGSSGTSTLTLDGDSTVTGTTIVGAAGNLQLPTGTLTNPSLAGQSLTNYGIYWPAAGMTFVSNGSALIHMAGPAFYGYSGAKFSLASNGEYGFGSAIPSTGSDTAFARSAAGVVKVTNGSTGIRGFLGGGSAVASATALPVPTGRVFHVTGTTTITSITSTNFQSGACVTLIFDDVLTFTDGSNLKLAGDFVTTADDTWHGCYDGTNWYEEGRSVN